jgi:hypothetical protein
MGSVEQRRTGLPGDRVSWGLATLAATAAAALLFATTVSLGITADGVIYFDAATRLIREGRLDAFHYGVVKPVTHYPPLLPAVLSLGLAAGQPILEFARWLNVVLLVATVVGVGATVHVATRSTAAALLASALTAFAADTIAAFATLLSEGLFLPLQIGTLLAISVYVSNGSRRALVLGAVAAAVACLVRFPAVVLVLTGVVAALLFRREAPLRGRVRAAALFAAIASAPLAVWLVVRAYTVGTATNREIAFHPVAAERLRQALDTFNEWLLPQLALSDRATLGVALVAAAALAVLCAAAFRRGGRAARFVAVHLAYALAYFAFLVLAVTLIDAQTPFDRRILLPLRIALVIPLVIGVHALGAAAPRAGRAAMAVVVVWLALSAQHMAVSAMRLHRSGYGYTGTSWRSIDLPRLVRTAGARIIYSNVPEALYFLTGVPARELPFAVDRWTRRSNPEFPRQAARMRAELDSRNAAIIYLPRAQRPFAPTADQLSTSLGLSRTAWGNSALVLRRTPALTRAVQADTTTPAAEVIGR